VSGWCSVYARSQGCTTAHVYSVSGDTDLVLTLFRAASVSGIVVMPDGAPARGADVRLRGGEYDCTSADAEGRFEFTAVDPRTRGISAKVDGGFSASAELALPEGGAASDVRLVLQPPARSYVHVRVADAADAGVPGATVEAYRHTTVADADGLATLPIAEPPGEEVPLEIRAEGFCTSAVSTRTFPSRDAPFLNVVLRGAVPVTVDAHAQDGTPLDPSVRFDGGDVTSTDRDSAWYLDPDATYSVRIHANGLLPLEIEGWRPPSGGGVLEATLRPAAAVRGRAVDAQGAPLACVFLCLDREEGSWRIDCQPDGSFLLEDLPLGRATMFVGSEDACQGAAIEIAAVSGQVTDVGTLVLVPHVALTGRIVDSESRPLGGATIRIGTGASLQDTYSHTDGTFRILAPGFLSGRLIVSKRGFGTVRLEVEAGPARSLGNLVLPAPGSVEIVESLDSEEEGDEEVEVAWPDGTVICRTLPGRIDALAPGRYVARLRHGKETLEQSIEVTSGETTTVTFRLER